MEKLWKARNQGKIDYSEVFDHIKSIKPIHAHFSGIEWTEKGEKNHKRTEDNEMNELAQEIVKRKKDITIINESPYPIEDSLRMKKVFEKLGIIL